MAEYRHLENAPITEALIDLRVRLPSDFNIEILASLKEELSKRYPHFEERRVISGGFAWEEGKSVVEAPKDMGIEGYFCRSQDKNQVVQFRRDGFTFSRLKPYTYWDAVLAEARSLWGLYINKTSVKTASRIAVRYINHLKIPLPIHDFKDYLTVPPEVPEKAPQAVSSFFSRVVVHDTEQGINANITQALEKSVESDTIPIILDIDVYKIGELKVSSNEIWDTLNKLRDLKNVIFFGSITEKTARLFE